MRLPALHIFSTTSYGPFHRSGPYTRFLRRALTIPVSWTSVGIGLSTVEPVMARAPHVGTAFQPLILLPIVAAALAGLVASIAVIWEYLSSKKEMGHGPVLLDILWQSLAIIALVAYLCMGIYSLVRTPASILEHLALASNEHPFQSHSSNFVLLTVAVFPESLRIIFLLILTYLLAAISLAETTGPLEPRLFSQTTGLLSFNLVYITAASWLVRKGITLDEAERILDLEKVASRTQQARTAARQRMNSFIHDHILSVLISVASGLANRRILTTTASQTLAILDQRVDDQSSSSSAQLFEHIRRMAHELSPRIAISEHHPESVTLPPGVGAALFDATHEALTNSFRHAATADYSEPSIHLRLSITDEGASITIDDDGNGITPQDLDTARLGIRRSILDRMRAAGGRASVSSLPGRGTRVILIHPLTQPHKGHLNPGTLSPMRIEDVIKLWPARAVIGYFIVAHIYQLLVHWERYSNPWIAVVAFLPFSTFALLFLLPWREGVLPTFLAYLVPIVGGIANIALLSQVTSTGWPGLESWSISFLAVLCWGLALYSRITAAGLGLGMLVAGIALWVINNNLPLVLIAKIATIHVMSILAWIAVVFVARWASVRIISDERRRMELEAERIESEQAAAVVESMLDQVDEQVRPILELVVSGKPITPEIRQQATLLEAELRDEIRGGTRLTSLIKDPVRQARERGVAVILMDDGEDAPLPHPVERELFEHSTRILKSTNARQVVVRLNPPSRSVLATITTEEERLTIASDGTVASS